MKSANLLLYLLTAFLLAWCLMVGGIALIGVSPLLYQGLVALAMFAPLLGVLAACRGLGRQKAGISWKLPLKGRLRYYALALWGPALLTLAGGVLYFALFPRQFDGNMTLLAQQLGLESFPLSLLLLQILQCVTFAPFLNAVFALGEEVGWRGWLTPTLQARLGRVPGVVASGVIWGLWHAPLILLAGYQYGLGYPGAPWTGLVGMCLFTTVMGILLSWLYQRAQSIWAPALAHGAINAIAALPLYFLADGGASGYLLGPTPAGLLSVLPGLALALVVLVRERKTVTAGAGDRPVPPESSR